MRIGGQLSSLERGVRQGSILSPSLFLLIMDPLLKQLQSMSLNKLYAGAYLHADIRTLSKNLSAQITAVTRFTSENLLQLNVSKCEIVTFVEPVPRVELLLTAVFQWKMRVTVFYGNPISPQIQRFMSISKSQGGLSLCLVAFIPLKAF